MLLLQKGKNNEIVDAKRLKEPVEFLIHDNENIVRVVASIPDNFIGNIKLELADGSELPALACVFSRYNRQIAALQGLLWAIFFEPDTKSKPDCTKISIEMQQYILFKMPDFYFSSTGKGRKEVAICLIRFGIRGLIQKPNSAHS